MKFLRFPNLYVVLVLLMMLSLCSACSGETNNPAVADTQISKIANQDVQTVSVDITPDFSGFDVRNRTSKIDDWDKLSFSDRCKVYAETRYIYGSRFASDYVAKYECIGDAKKFLCYQKDSNTIPTTIDFYWYGYAAYADREQVILTVDDSYRSEDTYVFTVTSNCNGESAIIYQSCSFYNINEYYRPKFSFSPYYQAVFYTREQFDDAIATGTLPENYVLYDTPPDADYIGKASFQLVF